MLPSYIQFTVYSCFCVFLQCRTLSALLQNLAVSDINEADYDGMTGLHWAAFHNRPEHVQLLMLRGGDIYKTDVDEKTPMHWASQVGIPRVHF